MSWPIWQAEHWLWALLVIPVLIVGYVLWTRSAGRAASRWADPSVMSVRPPARTRWMRTVAFAVALLAVAGGIVAMARPSVQATGHERRSSVMITLDVSNSMDKTDIQPSRLAAAVDAAERFVDAAPADTSIGVTTFADRASVLLAPTKDRATIHSALESITKTREGTALGAAVTTSLAALQANGSVDDPPPANPSDSPGRILVLTDGANSIRNATTPEAAAERAAAAGVPVYTILLGNDPGRPDQPLPSETLSAMANRTGGLFAQSTTTADLQAVFADIGSIVAPVDELRELTVWFAAGAAGLLLLAALIAGLSRPRPPRLGGIRTA
ncbi:MAG TPA: VWA domain-containing protein [Miltoncostaea sp.]|nr:VWA domain-containing protein [Miltoncostaea sp.]